MSRGDRFTSEGIHAAHKLTGATHAHAILKTCELVAALPSA